MQREILPMMSAAPRLQSAEALGFRPFDSGSAPGLRKLFAPLHDLIGYMVLITGSKFFGGPAFTRHRTPLSVDDCRTVYRALARDLRDVVGGREADRDIAARRCLVGQPVHVEMQDEQPTAVMRLCVGARLVTETWSPDPGTASPNLHREIDRIAGVVAKIELLLEHDRTEFVELPHAV